MAIFVYTVKAGDAKFEFYAVSREIQGIVKLQHRNICPAVTEAL